VASYPWRGFLLDDTPGIDAPKEHEVVTRQHLDASDAVLFVLATDGTLEEQRSFDEIVALVGTGKPIRVILNNKSGFRPGSMDFLNLRDRLAENLRRAAAAAGIEDIETRVPIRLVNAASGLRARLEGKSALLANSGLLELEADIAELCETTGKAHMARTVCRRIAKQIDLALTCLPADDAMQPFHEVADAIAAERTRLAAVLDLATQEAAAHFQADLTRALANRDPQLGLTAANDAADAVSAIIEREMHRTQRVFDAIESTFVAQTIAIRPVSGPSIPLPEGPAPQGAGFGFSDAAKFLTPALNRFDKETLVGGLMAAKRILPKSVFAGIGEKTFGKIVGQTMPFIGPAMQAVTGIYDAYSAHREAQKDFEREKDLRLALQQQVADAGRKMRWALGQQCLGIIESVFGPLEDALREQAAALKGGTAIVEADRAMLIKCKGRLEIALAD
jgi:hypothetical protein